MSFVPGFWKSGIHAEVSDVWTGRVGFATPDGLSVAHLSHAGRLQRSASLCLEVFPKKSFSTGPSGQREIGLFATLFLIHATSIFCICSQAVQRVPHEGQPATRFGWRVQSKCAMVELPRYLASRAWPTPCSNMFKGTSFWFPNREGLIV